MSDSGILELEKGTSTPSAGATNIQRVYPDPTTGHIMHKYPNGTEVDLEAPGGATVQSFEGRTGVVVSANGDYAASEITNIPSGNISSATVQAALNELDSEKAPITHVGSNGVSQHALADGSSAGFLSPSDFTKLGTVSTGATANQTDAYLLSRANHTGTQSAATITGLAAVATSGAKADVGLANVDNTSDVNKPVSTAQAAADAAVQAFSIQRSNHTGTQLSSTISDFSAAADARITAQKGAASGLATLDGSSKIPQSQLPAIAITETFVVVSQAAMLALTAQTGDVAVRTDLNKTFILQGSDPTILGNWQELLTPTSAVTSVNGQTGTVVVTKTDVGLSNVDNTSDVNKPVSTAQAASIATKEPVITATSAADYYRGDKTFQPLNKAAVGLSNVDNTADASKPVSTAQAAADAAVQAYAIQRANHTGTQSAGTITGLAAVATTGNKSDVGLSNVDNTSDTNKPVSTAQAAADAAVLASAIQRSNHTGTQLAATISDFTGAAQTAAVQNSLAAATVVAPSATAVNTGLALKVAKAGDTMTGPLTFSDTVGQGYVELFAQATTPSAPSNGIRFYSGATGRLAWKGTAGFAAAFDALSITGTRIYTLPDASITLMGDPMTTIGDTIIKNASNVTSRLGIGTTDQVLTVASGVPVWADIGRAVFFGGNSDGNLTLTGSLTLSQNMYYNNLTIGVGASLNTAGYYIYCKTLDLTNAPAGSIFRNGGNGNNTATNSAGTSGGTLAPGTLGGASNGSNGGAGSAAAGTASAAPGSSSPGLGGDGGNSGASGAGSGGAGVAAGAGGTSANVINYSRYEDQFVRLGTTQTGGSGGDGGNSGGGDGASSPGAGGGGSGGGIIAIYAMEIITGGSTPAGVIKATGGNGGQQTVAATGNKGGASGAGGGGGGYIYIAYAKKTGAAVTDLVNADGGNGGNGSNGAGTGIGGSGGQGGNGGRIQLYNVQNGIGPLTVGSSGATGTAASGTTAGLGGSSGTCRATL